MIRSWTLLVAPCVELNVIWTAFPRLYLSSIIKALAANARYMYNTVLQFSRYLNTFALLMQRANNLQTDVLSIYTIHLYNSNFSTCYKQMLIYSELSYIYHYYGKRVILAENECSMCAVFPISPSWTCIFASLCVHIKTSTCA